MNKNDLGKSPAFPMIGEVTYGDGTKETHSWEGMDLRTYIATKCLAGMLANNTLYDGSVEGNCSAENHRFIAEDAVGCADALIAELSKDSV